MQPRKSNGQFKSAAKRWTWRILVVFFLALLIQPLLPSRTVEFIMPTAGSVIREANAEEPTPEIVERMKQDIIAKLRHAETNGHEIADGELFYTNDPSGKMREACLRIGGKRPIDCDSFGPLQMKIPTIQGWHKELYDKTLTDMEALAIAVDFAKASQLAIDAIVNIPGSIYAWTGARNEKEFYEYVIPLIREYEN